jgi:hypothetical protein
MRPADQGPAASYKARSARDIKDPITITAIGCEDEIVGTRSYDFVSSARVGRRESTDERRSRGVAIITSARPAPLNSPVSSSVLAWVEQQSQ